jgi:hypothetical protein
MNLTNVVTATAKFTAVAGVSFYVGYFLVEGSLSFVAAMGLYAALFWAASEFKQRGLMSVTAVAAVLAVALFGLTPMCKSFGLPVTSIDWEIALNSASPVTSLCIGDACSSAGMTNVPPPVFVNDLHTNDPSITGVFVRQSAQHGTFFEIPTNGHRDESYTLRIKTADGVTLKKKVRPTKTYRDGKRCGPAMLDFSFRL